MSVVIQATRDSACSKEEPLWYQGTAPRPKNLPQKSEAVSEDIV